MVKALFIFPHRVGSVRVKGTWVKEAEEFAKERAEKKGRPKPSSWDMTRKIGQYAFVAGFKPLGDSPSKEKPYPRFLTLNQEEINLHIIPSHDKFTLTSYAKFKVNKRWGMKGQIHVFGQYDPPFVDFIGWVRRETLVELANPGAPVAEITPSDMSPITTLIPLFRSA